MKKLTEDRFNHVFNAFILIGMLVAVIAASALKFSDPEVSRFMLLLSAFGAIMGVVSTVLSANGIIWTFLFGLVDVLIYSFNLSQQTPLPISTLLLHVCYFIPMEFIGFYKWRKRGATGKVQVRSRHLDRKGWLLSALLFAVVFALAFALSHFAAGRGGAAVNLPKVALDALMTTANIVALVLMSMAYMEQWYLWTMVNVSSVIFWTVILISQPEEAASIVYLTKYVFYFINGINGIRIWSKLCSDKESLRRNRVAR